MIEIKVYDVYVGIWITDVLNIVIAIDLHMKILIIFAPSVYGVSCKKFVTI